MACLTAFSKTIFPLFFAHQCCKLFTGIDAAWKAFFKQTNS